jgi:dTDP-4-dehydrorhamnose reductase
MNHAWNGVTTLHFAKICHGIITHNLRLPHLQHVVPTGVPSKAELLVAFGRAYGRADIAVCPVAAGALVDRTLSTRDATLNRTLWRAAGYAQPPTVQEMIEELAQNQHQLPKLAG